MLRFSRHFWTWKYSDRQNAIYLRSIWHSDFCGQFGARKTTRLRPPEYFGILTISRNGKRGCDPGIPIGIDFAAIYEIFRTLDDPKFQSSSQNQTKYALSIVYESKKRTSRRNGQNATNRRNELKSPRRKESERLGRSISSPINIMLSIIYQSSRPS
jgi:hypothetical protein